TPVICTSLPYTTLFRSHSNGHREPFGTGLGVIRTGSRSISGTEIKRIGLNKEARASRPPQPSVVTPGRGAPRSRRERQAHPHPPADLVLPRTELGVPVMQRSTFFDTSHTVSGSRRVRARTSAVDHLDLHPAAPLGRAGA